MICNRSTVLSPTASGSSSDACQASTPSGRGTRLTTGTATFSVRQPSDHSPISFFFLQSNGFPAAHSGQSSHGSDGLTATGAPDPRLVDAVADALDPTGEVVAGHARERRVDPPVVLVAVGAAQRRRLDP